jgi:RNA polymerase sigma-70 factor (ECF subfamily)
VGAISTADEELLRQLYVDHGQALLGYARRLLGGDTHRAEDVVQETLLRAWRHPEAAEQAARDGTSIRGWLVTVARNIVIDGQRARAARPRETLAPDQADRQGSIDPALDRVLVAHELADALTVLTPEHRAVVTELYFRDRSVSQAAMVLQVPQGTVKSRAYYALRALRVACEERGILP